GIVECLLDDGDRVCILDPKGDHWGLRSSENGKGAGYPVVIFGGEHADVPLNAHAGAHVAEFRSIADHVDIVAMDLKPPSATGQKPQWAAHREFLRVAIARKVFVKVVITKHTATSEIEQARDLVAEIDKTIPFVLQPVTPAWKVKSGPTMAQLLGWQALCALKLEQVRIIPQVHRSLGDQ
ncbi:MAG: hypothetical protein AAB368_11825, partial [bacterium]